MTSLSTEIDPSAPGGALEKVALETYVPPSKPSLIGMSRAELAERLAGIGVAPAQRRMRAQQLWHWIYFRGARSFDEMTNISSEMRGELERHFTLDRPEMVAEQISSDGTRKWLLRLPSGDAREKPHEIECVYIPETDRGTLCVSSQVGCTLNCSFCHTGTQRLVRNLTAGEIVGQVMVARDRLQRLGRPRHAERQPPCHQCGDDGHGRAAVQFRCGARCAADRCRQRRHRHFAPPHHAVDLGRRAEYRPHRRRDRRHAGGLAACGARRVAQRAGAAEPQISDCGTAAGLPRLSGDRPTRGASPSNM